ncbi:MAG: hypothetical protein HeimC2_37730 [Candidatus Heimdallarchaeota archaeon LC_2]|nr:MAG: hypothetical protein HeimC2_37730 [Candidatus Heimdallarchaeota archaeon LC_2]
MAEDLHENNAHSNTIINEFSDSEENSSEAIKRLEQKIDRNYNLLLGLVRSKLKKE